MIEINKVSKSALYSGIIYTTFLIEIKTSALIKTTTASHKKQPIMELWKTL